MFTLHLSKTAEKELDRLKSDTRQRVLRTLTNIEKDPFSGKKLKGKLQGIYSYRVWPYRIIYEINKKDKAVLVSRIAHRQGVY